jgi:selenocysteine lyase/cysteine desulfurase
LIGNGSTACNTPSYARLGPSILNTHADVERALRAVAALS